MQAVQECGAGAGFWHRLLVRGREDPGRAALPAHMHKGSVHRARPPERPEGDRLLDERHARSSQSCAGGGRSRGAGSRAGSSASRARGRGADPGSCCPGGSTWWRTTPNSWCWRRARCGAPGHVRTGGPPAPAARGRAGGVGPALERVETCGGGGRAIARHGGLGGARAGGGAQPGLRAFQRALHGPGGAGADATAGSAAVGRVRAGAARPASGAGAAASAGRGPEPAGAGGNLRLARRAAAASVRQGLATRGLAGAGLPGGPACASFRGANFAKSNCKQPTNRINGLRCLFVQLLLKTSVPSDPTFQRVLARVDPAGLERGGQRWTAVRCPRLRGANRLAPQGEHWETVSLVDHATGLPPASRSRTGPGRPATRRCTTWRWRWPRDRCGAPGRQPDASTA